MTILFDINHPAHVHYFKNTIQILREEGNEVIVVSRNKEIEHKLLDQYKIPFISRGRGSESIFRKVFYYFYSVFLLSKIILRQKVDIVVSFMHPYGAHASFITGRKSLIFSDTENAKLHHLLTVPFASEIHTSIHFKLELGSKQKRFNSLMELSYLHLDNFQPNSDVKSLLNLREDEKCVFLRFVSRKSMHDFSHPGLTGSDKIYLVEALSKLFKVIISSEVPLPPEIQKYSLEIQEKEIHSVLYYSDLYIGESATMAAESALLGVPSIYIDDEGRGYTDYLEEKFSIISRFPENRTGVEKSLKKAREILESDSSSSLNREDIIADKLDMTKYISTQINRLYSSG